MKILSASQIKKLDLFTIKNEPISSIDLMDRASQNFTQNLLPIIGNKTIHIFCGPGNNGGDGLAVARLLREEGFQANCYYLKADKFSPDFEQNLYRTEAKLITELPLDINFENSITIDALFGIGLTRQLDGFSKEAWRQPLRL